MTDVTAGRSQDQEPTELSAADDQLLRELTERARAGGLRLTGEGGLVGKLTKMVVRGALKGELDDHLGYGKHDPDGRDGGNSRSGHHRAKIVLTDTGPVEISVPLRSRALSDSRTRRRAAIRCQRPLRETAIPRANVGQPQTTSADAEPLFAQLKCPVSLVGPRPATPGR